MTVLKVNPALRVLWKEGRTVLSVPGFSLKMLNDARGIELLSQFASPQEVIEVISGYQDSATAVEAVQEFYCNGAIVHPDAEECESIDSEEFVNRQSLLAIS